MSDLSLLEAVRLYPVVWVEAEPLVGIGLAFEALRHLDEGAMMPIIWNGVSGPISAAKYIKDGIVFEQAAFKMSAQVEQSLIDNLLTAPGLIVLADGLKPEKSPSVLQATISMVHQSRRVVFVSSNEPPPDFLRDYLRHVIVEPSEDDLHNEVVDVCESNKIEFDERFIPPLNGLRPYRAVNLMGEARMKAETNDDRVHYLYQARRKAIDEDTGGVVKMEEPKTTFAQLKGQGRAKKLLMALGQSLLDKKPVRGVILLGVQGCGKTRLATALAGELQLPLYNTDFASGFSKWQGETEEKFRRAIRTLESVPPGIVLVDELEKVLSATGGATTDSGVGKRSGQYLLRYMDNPKAGGGGLHLVIATSNDVKALPPEYTRAGRWDAILWFGIPSYEVLKDVLKMYVAEYKLDKSFGKDAGDSLKEMTPAEIESTCRIAATLGTKSWDEAVQYVPRLMRFRREEIQEMVSWSKSRAVDSEADEDAPPEQQLAKSLLASTKKGKVR